MAQIIQHLVLITAVSLSLPCSVQGHMEMRWPYSFRSKFNPANTDPDYSNTSPLVDDGSNYPCKGYKDLPGSQAPVVTYNPGQTYNLTLAGSANHGGGSCQISLSYDDGASFRVIKSMIGGCPLKLDYDFTIPDYAPPSQSAILAWTWFNHIGNREMYMQCARVAIAGQVSSGPPRLSRRERRTISDLAKRQSSIDALPEVFKCNIGNGCQTLENHEIIFSNPGTVIETGTDAGQNLPGPGYLLNGVAPPAVTVPLVSTTAAVTSTPYVTATAPGQFYPVPPSSSLTSTSSVPEFSPAAPTTNPSATTPTTLITQTTPAVTTTTSTTSPATAAPSPTLVPSICTPGTFSCNSPSTWSQCVATFSSTGVLSTTYIYMGGVAAGMQCLNGQIVRGGAIEDPSSPVPSTSNDNESTRTCAPVGVLQCDGRLAYHTCVNGDRLDMGPVPAGMTCFNGQVLVSL